MTRYLAFSFIIILVAAGCGQSESLSGAGTQESAEVESTRASTPNATFTPTEPEPTATSTSTSTPTVTPTPTSDGYEIIAIPPNGTKTETGPRPSVPDIASPEPGTPTVTPSPAVSPTPTAEPLIELPPVPPITSCLHAAELSLERIQIMLDVLTPYPEEVFTEQNPDPQLQATFEAIGEQLDEIALRSEGVACTESDLQSWIGLGIGDLVAEGPAAEWMLEALTDAFSEEYEEPPQPTAPALPEFTTCDEGVTLFIEKTQILFDSTVGMTVEEYESMQDPPEEYWVYMSEIIVMFEKFTVIGCTNDEVSALVLERIGELQARGEVAALMLEEMRQDLEERDFFEGL